MKYSISGRICCSDGTDIINTINKYSLWRLIANNSYEDSIEHYTFEVWVNLETDKTNLFEELKSFVHNHSGEISWHECTHDEKLSKPCLIVETYTKE